MDFPVIVTERDLGWWENLNRTEDRQWKHLCRAYNCRFIMYDEIPYKEIISLFPDAKIVVLDWDGKIDLETYIHPEKAVYIVGRSCQTLIGKIDDADYIKINTPKRITLFGLSAASILLAHREKQLG